MNRVHSDSLAAIGDPKGDSGDTSEITRLSHQVKAERSRAQAAEEAVENLNHRLGTIRP